MTVWTALESRFWAGAARELGVEVVIAAPSWDSSGASAALTAVQKDGQVVMKDLDASGLSGVRMLAVEAAPAFIAAEILGAGLVVRANPECLSAHRLGQRAEDSTTALSDADSDITWRRCQLP